MQKGLADCGAFLLFGASKFFTQYLNLRRLPGVALHGSQKVIPMRHSFSRLLAHLLIVVSLLSAGVAMAQAEPTMNQIYATAQAGKLDEAQLMVQQVLIAHPKSAKAFFVQAELSARQGKFGHARDSLATAEKYAPGLPFAKPDAVQALRSELAAKVQTKSITSSPLSYAAPQAPAASSSAWMLPLLLAGGVIVAGYFIFRRRTPQAGFQQPTYVDQGGLNGPQGFGMGGGTMQPQAAYPQPGYPQGYPQPAGTGLGGRIMGGVATGLAVGAGVMAAEAIGRNLMGGHNSATPQVDPLDNSRFEPLAQNTDMGGADFGINDTSWDDAGSGDVGGGDWDN